MKSNYAKGENAIVGAGSIVTIALRCVTCGSDSSFEQDKTTGVIKCLKCNRVYYGGKSELKDLNQRLLDDALSEMAEDVRNDLAKDITGIFKRAGFKTRR